MTIRLTGLSSGLDTDSIVQELVSAYKTKGEKNVKAQTKLSWKQDTWKSLNSKIYSFYKSLDSLRFAGGYNLKKSTVSDSTKASVTASNDAVSGTQTLEVKELATGGYLTGAELKQPNGADGNFTPSSTLGSLGYTSGEGTITIKGKDGKSANISVNNTTTISDFVKKINESDVGVQASFDAKNQRLFITSKSTGKDSDFTISAGNSNGTLALDKLGISSGTKVDGNDAKILLNDVEYTSSTNSFTVNGLTIQAQAQTSGKITITTNTDTDAIYDKIKNFLSEYNSLMNEMSKLYNADSSKGYEPLTDDEKDAMSETEVEQWEKKIKDSLLRRDSTLSGVMNAMSSAMSSVVTVGDKKYGLANLGIKTLGYFASDKNEKGSYHIDGDSDDENTSGNKDVLRAMIDSDPDTVASILKEVATNLYNNLDKKMKSTTLSSAYTVYNDKEMAKSYSDYTTTIKKWDEKVAQIEDSYYKKFAAMETALSKLDSQTSSLAGLLGS